MAETNSDKTKENQGRRPLGIRGGEPTGIDSAPRARWGSVTSARSGRLACLPLLLGLGWGWGGDEGVLGQGGQPTPSPKAEMALLLILTFKNNTWGVLSFFLSI